MTEITRSIEISEPIDRVWEQIDPKNWTKIFEFVKEVNGYTNGHPGVGTHAKVVAGEDSDLAVKYNVEITEFIENKKIVYRRYGGPLSGKGLIQLKPLQNGTLLTRISYYEDDLSEEIMHTLSQGMEKDNEKIKKCILCIK
ncbi:MAG: SRPBCC family protein [bacterium]